MESLLCSTTITSWTQVPNICRCCLTMNSKKELTAEYDFCGHKEVYQDMLLETFNLWINPTIINGSKGGICELCIQMLRDAHSFKKMVSKSVKEISKYVSLSSNSTSESHLPMEVVGIKLEMTDDDDNNESSQGSEVVHSVVDNCDDNKVIEITLTTLDDLQHNDDDVNDKTGNNANEESHLPVEVVGIKLEMTDDDDNNESSQGSEVVHPVVDNCDDNNVIEITLTTLDDLQHNDDVDNDKTGNNANEVANNESKMAVAKVKVEQTDDYEEMSNKSNEEDSVLPMDVVAVKIEMADDQPNEANQEPKFECPGLDNFGADDAMETDPIDLHDDDNDDDDDDDDDDSESSDDGDDDSEMDDGTGNDEIVQGAPESPHSLYEPSSDEMSTDDNNDDLDDGDETLTRVKKRESVKKAVSEGPVIMKPIIPTPSTEKAPEASKASCDSVASILQENTLKILENSTIIPFECKGSFRFSCLLCTFTSKNNVNKELSVHYRCHNRQEIEKKIISQKNARIKVDITVIKCKQCGEEFQSLSELKQHLSKHNIKLKSDGDLMLPFKITPNFLRCVLCDVKCSTFKLLLLHTNNHFQSCGKKAKRYKAGGAGKIENKNTEIEKSKNKDAASKIEKKNDEIDKSKNKDGVASTTENKNNEIDATKNNSKIKEGKFVCQYCQERFFNGKDKAKHLFETHEDKTPKFNCWSCSKTFLTNKLLTSHVKRIHFKKNSVQMTSKSCKLCGRAFKKQNSLINHLLTHYGERQFSCIACHNRCFATDAALKKHMSAKHGITS